MLSVRACARGLNLVVLLLCASELDRSESTEALFGWAFGFGFWPQKPKAQPKGLFLEGAFSEAAAFP